MGRHVYVSFYVLIIVIFRSVLPALAWEGRVVDIDDGDTIMCEPVRGGKRIKVRLHGIDCPNYSNPMDKRKGLRR